MMETFENRVRFESILVRLRGVGIYRSLNPIGNLLVGAGSQSGYWMVFLIDAIKQVACPRQLLDSPRPPRGYMAANVEVT